MGCGASSDSQESSIGILDGVPVQNRELAFLEDMPTELRAPQEVPSELQATIVGGGWGKSAAQRATAKTAGAALPEWTQAPRCHVEHTGRVLIRNAAAHGVTDLEFLAGRADVALRPSPDLSDAWSVHTNEPMREGCGVPDPKARILYFEATIKSIKDASIADRILPGRVAIGWVTAPYAPFRLPGEGLYSIGLHHDGVLRRADMPVHCDIESGKLATAEALSPASKARMFSPDARGGGHTPARFGTQAAASSPVSAHKVAPDDDSERIDAALRLCDPLVAGDVIGAGYQFVKKGELLAPGSRQRAEEASTVFFFCRNGQRLRHVPALVIPRSAAKRLLAQHQGEMQVREPTLATDASGMGLLAAGVAYPCVGAMAAVTLSTRFAAPFAWDIAANLGPVKDPASRRRRSRSGSLQRRRSEGDAVPIIVALDTDGSGDESGADKASRGRRRSAAMMQRLSRGRPEGWKPGDDPVTLPKRRRGSKAKRRTSAL